MCKSVTIESCSEGFVVWNLDSKGLKTQERYAVSRGKLVQTVNKLLGITDKSKAVVWAGTEIEMIKPKRDLLINDSSDSSFPKYNFDMSINSNKPIPAFVFTEIGSFEVSVQPITKGKTIYWLHSGGKKIKIARDGYSSIFIYANISDLVYLHAHPDEAPAILEAYGKATYKNKANVLRGILKDVPLSALVGDNHHDDAIIAKKEEPKGQEDGSCDDVAFESCANNTPEQCKYCIDQSRYENKNKLAAKKPAPPLMKASVPP